MTSGMTLPDPALLARDRGITLPCQRRDAALWYPEPRDPEASEKLAYARAQCMTCPLRVECLTRALAVPERHGIWGGLTEAERRTVLQGKRLRNRLVRELAGQGPLVRPAVRAATAAA